jgi:hypothetical protein
MYPRKNIIKICNKACLLNIQIYIKIDELLFLPEKSLSNHNQENFSHYCILIHGRRLSTEWCQPALLPTIKEIPLRRTAQSYDLKVP